MVRDRSSRRPLQGIRVVVTRAAHQAQSTVRAFEEAGARVERLPLLEVVLPEDPARLDVALFELVEGPGSTGFDWALFTSPNAAERVLDRLDALSAGPFPESVRVAAIGSATTATLRDRGVEPDLEATESRAEGLAELLTPRLDEGDRVFLPQAADARDVLEELLSEAGARVVRVAAYAKRVPPESPERARQIFGDGPFDRRTWVTFTSPSIARGFAGLFGDGWEELRDGLRAVSIGPVTSAALRELGVEPAEAESPGDGPMVAAVCKAVAGEEG